jgi:hypothetical protein
MPEREVDGVVREMREWESTMRDIDALPEVKPRLLAAKGILVGFGIGVVSWGVAFLVFELVSRL